MRFTIFLPYNLVLCPGQLQQLIFKLALNIFYILIEERKTSSLSRVKLLHTFQNYMRVLCGVIYGTSYVLKVSTIGEIVLELVNSIAGALAK